MNLTIKSAAWALLLVVSTPLTLISNPNNRTNYSIEANCRIESDVEEAVYSQTNTTYSATQPNAQQSPSLLLPIIFVIVALLLGFVARYINSKTPIPYMVTLLIIGLLLGVLSQASFTPELLSKTINWAGSINPLVVLYLFLPIVLFKVAYGLHQHAFRRNLSNSLLLAIPGLIVAIVVTALAAMAISLLGLGLNGWTWATAAIFGTIISATDPVATSDLLGKMGVSRKLTTLSEGEALLNSSTTIVFFLMLMTMVAKATTSGMVVGLLSVMVGGIAIGAAFGWVIAKCLKRIYNDMLLEITLIATAVFLSFYVSEYIFSTSGIISVVTFGIIMAGTGKTRISTSTKHFVHNFLECASFLANTLILIVAGIIIAQQVTFTAIDTLILLLIYFGIHVARLGAVYLFYPIMKRIGYRISMNESVTLWWNGLRGTIALGLALIANTFSDIPAEVRSQILFLTAGTVVLTSLINATTMRWLVAKLELSKIGIIKTHLLNQTLSQIKLSGEKEIEKMQDNRFLSDASWNEVASFLVQPSQTDHIANDLTLQASIVETRKRLLQKEKEIYWQQFNNGLLSARGMNIMSDQIETLMDKDGHASLSSRNDIETLWRLPSLVALFQKTSLTRRIWKKQFFNRLAVSFECARATVTAQEENLKTLNSLHSDISANNPTSDTSFIATLNDELNENKIIGLTFIRNLQETHPDICSIIETQLASRALLNQQQEMVDHLTKLGLMDIDESRAIEQSLKNNIKRLQFSPLSFDTNTRTIHILGNSPSFGKLSQAQLRTIIDRMKECVHPAGTKIGKQGVTAEGISIIINGNARIEKDSKSICIYGLGDIYGAMEYVKGYTNPYTLIAETPVTTMQLNHTTIEELKKQMKDFETALDHASIIELSTYLLRQIKPYSEYSLRKMHAMLRKAHVVEIDGEDKHYLDGSVCVLLEGTASTDEHEFNINAPSVLTDCNIRSVGKSKILVVP